jgi:hypothetical protein
VAVFSFITLGVYFCFWWYAINRELRDYGRTRDYDLGQSPATSTLAVTLGALVVVPFFVSLYRGTQRIQQAQRLAADPDLLNGWIALLLYLVFFPAFVAYLQTALNGVWSRAGHPVVAELDTKPPSSRMPPPLGPNRQQSQT